MALSYDRTIEKSNDTKTGSKSPDTFTAPFVIFLTSLVPFPLTYILSNKSWMEDPRIILAVGIVALVSILVISYTAVRKMENPDFILYVINIFMFSGMIDIIIALEADFNLGEFMTFYLKEGEPYLWTAHGTMIDYWDGTVQYGLCLWILISIYRGQSYRKVGLYWVGSITNSLLVLVPGSLLGDFKVKWAIFMNVPYFFVPLWIGYKLLTRKEDPLHRRKTVGYRQESIIKRPSDLLFVLYFIFAIGVYLFRGFAALGCDEPPTVKYLKDFEPYIMDPIAFPKVQVVNPFSSAAVAFGLERLPHGYGKKVVSALV